MLVSQILKQKGDMVFTASPTDSVAAVAALLQARRVGAMVVLDQDRDVAGIVSERDIVRIVAERGADGLTEPVVADPAETVDQLLERMTDRRIRHLPVCQEGRLIGIVSIGDLVKSKIAETVAEAENLKAYISA
jgi:CBS domain-containing protein